MATKLTGRFGKLGAALFTSVVAPILVNLAVHSTPETASQPDRKKEFAFRQVQTSQSSSSCDPAHAPSSESQALSPYQSAFASSPLVQTLRIRVRGVGPTFESALQDAFRLALRQALASVVKAPNEARNDSVRDTCDLADRTLILGWQELRSRKEWGRKGLCYCEEVAVEVNLSALADRLRTRSNIGWNNPSRTTPHETSSPHFQLQ